MSGFNSSCGATVDSRAEIQSIAFKLQVFDAAGAVVPGAAIKLKPSSGTVHPESGKTNPNGEVQATWFRARSSESAMIVADGMEGTIVRSLIIDPTFILRDVSIELNKGHDQHWWEKATLRWPVSVKLLAGASAPLTETDCRRQRVLFQASATAGSVAPDTALAEVVNGVCIAETRFTLGAGPGSRRIRATLLPTAGYQLRERPTTEIKATARALPRLVSGLALAHRKAYVGLKPGAERIVTIEEPLPDGGKRTYQVKETAPNSIDTVKATGAGAVVLGLSTPLVPGWKWLAVVVGLDLAAPKDRFYVGFTPSRFFGLSTEAFNVDLHILWNWSRDAHLENVSACIANGECNTNTALRPQGFAAMLSIDAGSILADVIKKLVSP